MTILSLKDFMKNYILKIDTMNESDLQRICTYPIFPRGSKIYSDKGFVDIENGYQGRSHWVCFIIKDNKPYYFDSFGGTPD